MSRMQGKPGRNETVTGSWVRVIPKGALSLALVGGLFGVFSSLMAESEPKAVELANKVMEAMGGKENWEATRFIRFNFFGNRLHYWDKHTGRHRVEFTDRETDQQAVALQNINSREGRVYLNGDMAQGEEKARLLKRAYGTWINDTYWLLMPYKLTDPGVTLKHAGTEEINGITYDKLHLSFAGVGLTPGDQYWAYINPQTGLMDRWDYKLESGRESQYYWKDWQKFGNIMISPSRVPLEGDARLMTDIAVFDDLPDSVFESPGPVQLP